jgi:hypothetical protein
MSPSWRIDTIEGDQAHRHPFASNAETFRRLPLRFRLLHVQHVRWLHVTRDA